MFPPNPYYPNNDNHTLPVFDLRYPGVAQRLHRERAAWREHEGTEAPELHHRMYHHLPHFIPVFRTGRARRLVA